MNVWSSEPLGGFAEASIGTVRSVMDVNVITTQPEDEVRFDWQAP